MNGKHLRPIPGYKERTIRDKDGTPHTIMDRVTITKVKNWSVLCTRPGTEPVSETHHVTASTSQEAGIKAARIMRASLRCGPTVMIITKPTELHPEIGAAVKSTVNIPVKVDRKRGVTKSEPKPKFDPLLTQAADTLRNAVRANR